MNCNLNIIILAS